MESRKIVLQLRKPYYEKYLRYIFEADENGPIRITRCNDPGRYLYSQVLSSDFPHYPKKICGTTVDLIMPSHGSDSSRNHFIYFSREATDRINDYIEAASSLDFQIAIHVGTKEYKIDRKTVVSIFSNDMFGEDKSDMLTKKEYRRRLNIKNLLKNGIKIHGNQSIKKFISDLSI